MSKKAIMFGAFAAFSLTFSAGLIFVLLHPGPSGEISDLSSLVVFSEIILNIFMPIVILGGLAIAVIIFGD